ncbi:MAG: ATP-binding cassette domain-containing protein, partial [Desulfobacterales bacterium]|nr:ATP-binding cassette domain-containing protein [Desulfobacterales bacterium]
GLFKRRLLFGAMKLEPEETRRQGAGQFVGRVMESEALDAVALESGFYALFAVMQLVVAAWVLSMGAGGALHALLLPGWMVVVFLICARYYTRSRALVETCRNLTYDLVERMVGRRTRLAQEDPNRWHDEEDQALENYLDLSRRMDRSGVAIRAFLSRGWMITGVIGILWAFMDPSTSAAALAVSVGGVLLALQALDHFNLGAVSLINARIAWEQAAPLFAAAARPGEPPAFAADAPAQTDKRRPVLMLRDVSFRYSDHGRMILKRCGVEVFEGDRLLLRGPSGSGKSTLASLAAGLRTPGSGLALFRGVDRRIMGAEQWRERAAAAPQFHENHVFTETFAFNLLMGRGWPPGPGDLKEAGAICRELGLGELIDRMPAGFLQMVGEGGWRLSHGERSRLFIARAILQSADVMILDESFAALDPENLQRALTCVLQRVPTLIVIANP